MMIECNGQPMIFNAVKLQQYNNMVDSITLSIPRMYNGLDMSDATARIAVSGCPSLVEDVSEAISKEVTDVLIKVTWTVSRDYTETAGDKEAQLSMLDAEERAMYTRTFRMEVLPSVEFSEWENDHTIWDDYLAQFGQMISRAETVEAEMTEFNEAYDGKLQAINQAGQSAIAAINAAAENVGWTVNSAGNIEVTIGGAS